MGVVSGDQSLNPPQMNTRLAPGSKRAKRTAHVWDATCDAAFLTEAVFSGNGAVGSELPGIISGVTSPWRFGLRDGAFGAPPAEVGALLDCGCAIVDLYLAGLATVKADGNGSETFAFVFLGIAFPLSLKAGHSGEQRQYVKSKRPTTVK